MCHLLLYRPRNPSHSIDIFAGHTEGSARVRVCLRFLGYGGSHGYESEADDKSAYVDGSVRPTTSDLFQRRNSHALLCFHHAALATCESCGITGVLVFFPLEVRCPFLNPLTQNRECKAPRLDELGPCIDIRPAHAYRVRPSQRVLNGLRL